VDGANAKDVTDIARASTGWTMTSRAVRGFQIRRALHIRTRVCAREKIHAAHEDGAVHRDARHHPSTANSFCELARRFVSDNPPPSLVNRMRQTFKSTTATFARCLKTMIWSPEFWSRERIARR